MIAAFAMLVALLLDAWWGEPRRAHPLVAFGRLVALIERCLYADRRSRGVLAWCLAVLPLVALLALLRAPLPALPGCVVDTVVLYVAVGRRSLAEHALPVAVALDAGDLEGARQAVGRMVSRDTEALDASRVAAAATESVLENGHDAVFGALFWFLLLGAPGVLAFRLANTLDAMWGYRTSRYLRFGWAAARIDDVLGYVPARLTAFTYALAGDYVSARRCWTLQARLWDSPNAGPVMAAGAGALKVELGGPAPYHGRSEERPALGAGGTPDAASIRRALRLVNRGVAIWIGLALITGIATHA